MPTTPYFHVSLTTDPTTLVGRAFRIRWFSRGEWYAGHIEIESAIHSPTGNWMAIMCRCVPDHRSWKVEHTAMALVYGETELTPAAG